MKYKDIKFRLSTETIKILEKETGKTIDELKSTPLNLHLRYISPKQKPKKQSVLLQIGVVLGLLIGTLFIVYASIYKSVPAIFGGLIIYMGCSNLYDRYKS